MDEGKWIFEQMTETCLMGNIGDRTELGKFVKMNDLNEYTVIAGGGTFIHILNAQLRL